MELYDCLKNGNGIDIWILGVEWLLLVGKLLFFVDELKG